MPRLLKSEAEMTAQSVIAATYKDKHITAQREYAAASHDMYDNFLGQEELTIINLAPEGHYYTERHLSFRWKGQHHSANFDGRIFGYNAGLNPTISLPDFRRVRRVDRRGLDMNLASPAFHSTMANRTVEAEEAVESLQKEMRAKYDTLVKRLRNMGTVQAIAKGWPEIVPYMPTHVFEPIARTQALVIPRKALNAQYGLPVETEA